MDAKELDREIARRIVYVLNEALKLDRPAVAALVANRVPCNRALADHRTIEVGTQHGGYNVGMLGILNGICRQSGVRLGPIAAVFEGEDNTFKDLVRFMVIDAQATLDGVES